MVRNITPGGILDIWAKKPLDFEPGTRWQYSNTNYVIIGQIIEKITGKPLIDFLRTRIFGPLGMGSPIDESLGPWDDSDPTGYETFALGPPRPAKPEGNGWMYAMGELAMTAEDLARWDISLMNDTILQPASLKTLTTEVLLKSGTGTRYALGLDVSTNSDGHRHWSHGGEASGFISSNATLPDDHAAVAVLTNGQGRAASSIERQIEDLMLAPAADPEAAPALERAKQLFAGLQKCQLNKSLLTSDAIAYFTDQGRCRLRGIARAAGRSFQLHPKRPFGTGRHDGAVVLYPRGRQNNVPCDLHPAGRQICPVHDRPRTRRALA